MERKKYLVIKKTEVSVFESSSERKCKAYIRRAIKKGAEPGAFSIVWDWPTEIRCPTCAEGPNCPAFDTGVSYPCPHYQKKEDTNHAIG